MYDKRGVVHVGNVVANVTLLSLAAVAGAVSNPLVAGVSTGIYTVKEGIVPLLQKSLEKQGDALYLTVPGWWSGDARSWQDVCTEAERHLPIIIDATTAQLKKEAQAPTEAVVRRVLVQEIGTHLPPFLVPDNRNLFANELATSLPKKSADLLRQAVDPLKADALAKDVARAIQTLERIASAPATPQTASSAPSTSSNSSQPVPSLTLEQKWEQGAFDVYMCYHQEDQAEVEKIDARLKAEGILPWFDFITVDPVAGTLQSQWHEQIKKAGAFGRHVQRAYLSETSGGASVTYASLPLPEHIKDIGPEKIPDSFELLQWHLQEAKHHPPETLTLASHPFMRLCDSCGSEYAAATSASNQTSPDVGDIRDAGEIDEQYCMSCQCKRVRDKAVKKLIEDIESRHKKPFDEHMWATIILRLRSMGYELPPETEQPDDFNVFRDFKGFKDYIGLIYADANNIGRAITACESLIARKTFAEVIDTAIYEAVCTAIGRHLKVNDLLKSQEQLSGDRKRPVFPFDILLMGGDDICMVVPASVALDVALTLAETFRDRTQQQQTLSVGVVLAPIKYPFGLLQEMAETTLKFAKKAGADARIEAAKTDTRIDDTRINYMIVTGSSSSNFKTVFDAVYSKKRENMAQEFFATVRPFTLDDLRRLLVTIRSKESASLGRSKLYQMREAVLKMNLTTSVGEGLAVLKNWRPKQRNYIVQQVYEFGGRHQLVRSTPEDPASRFTRVSFPWFADGKDKRTGKDIYRTVLLDFIELYDFVFPIEDDMAARDSSGEGGNGGDEA